MFHNNSVLSNNHSIHSWEVQNIIARDLLPVTINDIGKAVNIISTHEFYILSSILPNVWKLISGSTTSNGVSSFNSRTGAISLTSSDVTDALGYAPGDVTSSQLITLITSNINSASQPTQVALKNAMSNANIIDRPIKISIIGDSISDAITARPISWAGVMSDMINMSGTPTIVNNFAIGGYTSHLVMNNIQFGTTSMVQKCINSSPDVVIVMIGANDAASSRTTTEINNDIVALGATLRAGLPNAKLVFIAEILYDKTNFTPSTLKVKGIVQFLATLPTSGILAGSYTTEMLDLPSDAVMKNIISRSDTFNAAAVAAPYWDGVGEHNHWKVSRLGCMMYDRLHPDVTGTTMIATNIIKSLSACTFASTMFPGLVQYSSNIIGSLDGVFAAVLTPVGDGYVPSAPSVSGEDIAYEASLVRKINHTTWEYPYRTRHTLYPLSISRDTFSMANATFDGGPPNSVIQLSINGDNFVPTDVTTNSHGYGLIQIAGADFNSAGSYVIRFKISDEVYGPYSLSVISPTEISTRLQFCGQTETTAGAVSYFGPNGKSAISNANEYTSTDIQTIRRCEVFCSIAPGAGQVFTVELCIDGVPSAASGSINDNQTSCTMAIPYNMIVNKNSTFNVRVSTSYGATQAIIRGYIMCGLTN